MFFLGIKKPSGVKEMDAEKKTKVKEYFAIALLVIIIALVIYFMVITNKRNEEYNTQLCDNISGLIGSSKSYYITDYDKDDIYKYDVKKFRSVIQLGYGDSNGVVAKVSNYGEVKDEGYVFVAERIGKKKIRVLLNEPEVLSHDIYMENSHESITEANDKTAKLKQKIEGELISSKDKETVFVNTENIIKAYLTALGYTDVEIIKK